MGGAVFPRSFSPGAKLWWWRRQWHPIPVLLPGKSHGRRSLVGCSPWGRSLRVRLDWATSLSLFTFMPWKRKWQPTPVLSCGKFHGWRSLVGYSPWGRKEWTPEQLHFSSNYSGGNEDNGDILQNVQCTQCCTQYPSSAADHHRISM